MIYSSQRPHVFFYIHLYAWIKSEVKHYFSIANRLPNVGLLPFHRHSWHSVCDENSLPQLETHSQIKPSLTKVTSSNVYFKNNITSVKIQLSLVYQRSKFMCTLWCQNWNYQFRNKNSTYNLLEQNRLYKPCERSQNYSSVTKGWVNSLQWVYLSKVSNSSSNQKLPTVISENHILAIIT